MKKYFDRVAESTAASRSAGLQACQRPPGSPKGPRYLQFCNALLAAILIAVVLLQSPLAAQQSQPFVRDPKIPIDAEYTKKIKEYTTETFFTSPLVDYLPASKTVPTPKEILGDVAGAPGRLPYAEEVYQYMRLLEKASPRVKVFSIGRTEEGREIGRASCRERV